LTVTKVCIYLFLTSSFTRSVVTEVTLIGTLNFVVTKVYTLFV